MGGWRAWGVKLRTRFPASVVRGDAESRGHEEGPGRPRTARVTPGRCHGAWRAGGGGPAGRHLALEKAGPGSAVRGAEQDRWREPAGPQTW